MKKLMFVLALSVLVSANVFSQNNALDFDGTNDYVDLGNSNGLKPTSALTFECWMNPDSWSISGNHHVFAGNTQSGGYNIALGYPTGTDIGFAVYSFSAYRRVDASVSGFSGWHHVGGTFDGQYVKLYIDGQLVDEFDMSTSGNTITYTVSNSTLLGAEAGSGSGSGGYEYDGKLDEVRFWNVVRTQTEIQDNMYTSLAGNESGLIAYYKMTDGSGTSLTDNSTNSYTGTLTNGVSWTDDIATVVPFDTDSDSKLEINNDANLFYLSLHSGLWDLDFIQTADIAFNEDQTLVDWDGDGVLEHMDFYPENDDYYGLATIGNNSVSFSGEYDGQNHTITNLYINRDQNYVGLFGKASGGTVKNLGLPGVYVRSASYNFVGGLIGYQGTAINCYTTGTVSGAACVGGLMGYYGNAQSCYSTANVSGYYNIGGLMGTGGSASNCYAMGNVSSNIGPDGGLIGSLEVGHVINCYSASSSQTDGGLIGEKNPDENMASVTNSFWDVTISNQSTSDGGTGKTTAEMKDVNTYWNSTWDFVIETVNGTNDYWEMDESGSVNSGYPFLFYQNGDEELIPDGLVAFSGGAGTEEDPYKIADLDDLIGLSDNSGYWGSGTYFIQTANIDASSTSGMNSGAGFSPIGNGSTSFGGNYNGQNYTISGLTIDRDQNYVGLFGRGGTISNLGVVNCSISNASGNYTGALVGRGGTVTNCYSTGTVSGASHVGGLIGYWGSAESCYSSANVTGFIYVGGLMGTGGSASNCYAMGNVSSIVSTDGGLIGSLEVGDVIHCYSASSSQTEGGLIGDKNPDEYMASVTNSFWDVTISGQSTSDGGTGKTTAEMKTLATFTDAGWDFELETDNGENDYWDLDRTGSTNDGYPFLSWQNGGEIALPVMLASFEAVKRDNSILLRWSTTCEIGLAGFTVSRRSETSGWIELSGYQYNPAMCAVGNEISGADYEYKDTTAVSDKIYQYCLHGIDYAGQVVFESFTELSTGVEIYDDQQPEKYALYPAYPNPFNPTTTIKFALPENQHVRIRVFDVTGRQMAELVDAPMSAGFHRMQWHAANVGSGVYFIQFETDKFCERRKCLLVK